jgi:prevent-host-death family protein
MDRIIKAAEFKQTCLALMDQVSELGDSITITKRGKPVAKLVPAQKRSLFGCLKGQIQILEEDFSLPDWSVSPRKGKV